MTQRHNNDSGNDRASDAAATARTTETARKRRAIREGLDELDAGKQIPLEEIEAWVESWDTPEEKPRPNPDPSKTT